MTYKKREKGKKANKKNRPCLVSANVCYPDSPAPDAPPTIEGPLLNECFRDVGLNRVLERGVPLPPPGPQNLPPPPIYRYRTQSQINAFVTALVVALVIYANFWAVGRVVGCSTIAAFPPAFHRGPNIVVGR